MYTHTHTHTSINIQRNCRQKCFEKCVQRNGPIYKNWEVTNERHNLKNNAQRNQQRLEKQKYLEGQKEEREREKRVIVNNWRYALLTVVIWWWWNWKYRTKLPKTGQFDRTNEYKCVCVCEYMRKMKRYNDIVQITFIYTKWKIIAAISNQWSLHAHLMPNVHKYE